MIKSFVLFLYLVFNLSYADEFTVASYNVENLFDNKDDGTEYQEFKPSYKFWNEKSYKNKLKNTQKVIKDISADIIVLQEIENNNIFQSLKNNLNYKYSYFHKKKEAAIGQAILSKYPIVKKDIIKISHSYRYRDILKINLKIKNQTLTLYLNHWSSKRNKESHRIKSAYKLMQYIKSHHKNDDYIILGDLNEDYDEYLHLKQNDKLNDTDGISAINQVLNTTINGNFVNKKDILYFNKRVHYNPWLEENPNNRFSSLFKKQKHTPDNILLSQGLFDNRGITYMHKSFKALKFKYLFKKDKLNRWNFPISDGYSDHLPVIARFSTIPKKKLNLSEKPKINIKNISDLYLYNTLLKPVRLNNCFLLYKNSNIALIKRKDDRAILIYGNVKNLNYNTLYNLDISKIDTYLGNKEIKKYSIINKKNAKINIQDYYFDGKTINLYDPKYLNEIITNIKATYSHNTLFFNNKKIKIYFKKNVIKPKENSTILLHRGIISKYKTQTQVTISSNNDFSIVN